MTDSEGSCKRSPSPTDRGDGELANKRPRSGGRAVDVRFLLQSKNAGAIIGKGGSNINRLRKDYKASVTVPDCPGPERILSIVTDLDTLGEILLDIIPKLEDYVYHRTLSFDCEIRMLLHQSHAGCIIGRAGQRIKELRDKTGAHIKVYSVCCPASTERVVQISGFPNVVVNCVKEICDIISQAPIKGPNKTYDPHNYNSYCAAEYGGYLDASGRGRGRDGPDRGGINPWQEGPPEPWGPPPPSRPLLEMGDGGGRMSSKFRGNESWGNPPDMNFDARRPNLPQTTQGYKETWWNGPRKDDFGSSGSGMLPIPMDGPGRGPGNQMPYGGGPPRGSASILDTPRGFPPKDAMMGMPDRKPLLGPNQGGMTTSLSVAKELAGAIIGKGGQRIRKIRRDSGAGITIEEAQPGASERVITISGTPEEVQIAQRMLQQSIRENSGRRY